MREESQLPAGQTFPPETWQKDLIEPACLACVPTLDTLKVGDIEGPARKLRTQAELSRGKNHAQKTTTTRENLLSLAADSGADANKNHNNQPHKHFHARLGRVSLQLWVDWAAVALTASPLIRGRLGGGCEQKPQQPTMQTFSCMSWACVSALLDGLGGCGSHGITSHPRPFFACSSTGWLF